MKNRAKCKLCKDTIQSKHANDYVLCSCGEIGLDGGDENLLCFSKSWENFLRIDDEGNEIQVTVKEKENLISIHKKDRPTRKELLELLETMIKTIEDLPPAAMQTYITHYDFVSALILISSILHEDDCNLSS